MVNSISTGIKFGNSRLINNPGAIKKKDHEFANVSYAADLKYTVIKIHPFLCNQSRVTLRFLIKFKDNDPRIFVPELKPTHPGKFYARRLNVRGFNRGACFHIKGNG